MLLVVGLEVVLRMGDEALHLRAQQQIAQRRAVVVAQVGIVAVGHGQREVVGLADRVARGVGQLVVEGLLLVGGGGEGGCNGVDGRCGGVGNNGSETEAIAVVVVHKHQALGQYVAIGREERDHVDARLQRLVVEGDLHLAGGREVELAEVAGLPTGGDAQAQR